MNLESFFTSIKTGLADFFDSLSGRGTDLASQIKSYRDNTDIKEILAASKLNEILRKDEEEAEMRKKSPVFTVLAVIGAIAAVACIAYAVYKYFTPDYLDDFDDGEDDFDDDDLFEDEDEIAKPEEKEVKEETKDEADKEEKTETSEN